MAAAGAAAAAAAGPSALVGRACSMLKHTVRAGGGCQAAPTCAGWPEPLTAALGRRLGRQARGALVRELLPELLAQVDAAAARGALVAAHILPRCAAFCTSQDGFGRLGGSIVCVTLSNNRCHPPCKPAAAAAAAAAAAVPLVGVSLW